MELMSGSFDSRISKSACNNQSNNLASVCSNHRVSEIDVVENKDIYAAENIDDVENKHICIYDAVYEILMRTDPRHLFICVLVSKDWLSIITSPGFQKNYLRKWKNSTSIVVGMFMSDKPNGYRFDTPLIQPGLQLLPTSKLGQNMIFRTSRGLSRSKTLEGKKVVMRNYMPKGYFDSKSVRVGQKLIIRNRSMGFFVSKSSTGGHLLYSGNKPDTFYVCKSTFGSSPVELPPPPAHYESCMANVLSDVEDDSKYRVILACALESRGDGKLRIQTYYSWTGKWEPSMLTCPHSLRLVPSYQIRDGVVEGGVVTCGGTGGGVIYWKARTNKHHRCLAVWDINGGSISEIPRPPIMAGMLNFQDYNMAPQPQGSLVAATYGYKVYCNTYHWESELFTINIWVLNDDKKEWNLLHSVRHATIWANNLALLNSLFDARPPHEGFEFASFFPGKSDSIFVGLKHHLFVYHFHTGKLEYVDILKRGFGFKGFSLTHLSYHPLTMLDSGIWPSSPMSLQLPRS